MGAYPEEAGGFHCGRAPLLASQDRQLKIYSRI